MAASQALELALPTPNKALFEGGGDFYMHVNRDFGGVRSTPWEGGQFGFVRTPVLVGGRKVYRRFHEGIDIRPVKRMPDGEPVDPVFAIADGIVRHASPAAGASNYGRYLVIEHAWDGSPVYSLYAHLAEVGAGVGDRVRGGDRIGRVGYTGRGIDKSRAHLHLEIALMYSTEFDGWHQRYFAGSPNHHGIYNGLNLFSVDPAALYKVARSNPGLRFAEFVRAQPAFFTVRLPVKPRPQVLQRYPWLVVEEGGLTGRARSWELDFTAYGLVVGARPSEAATAEPRLISVKNSPIPYSYATRGLLTGSQGSAALSSSGQRTMHLLVFSE